jgi:acid stress-induced BolA-like protein IbaG/YrbA
MQAEEIKQLLASAIESESIDVKVEGSHVDVVVVSHAFEGLNPVKKQQMVYAVLDKQIADGSIHAVNMKTYTPAQWAQH